MTSNSRKIGQIILVDIYRKDSNLFHNIVNIRKVKCSTSLEIQEMPIKTTSRVYFTSKIMAYDHIATLLN